MATVSNVMTNWRHYLATQAAVKMGFATTQQRTGTETLNEQPREKTTEQDNIQKWILNRATVCGPPSWRHVAFSVCGRTSPPDVEGKGKGCPVTCQNGTGTGAEGGGWSAPRSSRFILQERDPVHIAQVAVNILISRGQPTGGAPQTWFFDGR